jgi:hypothetical protein
MRKSIDRLTDILRVIKKQKFSNIIAPDNIYAFAFSITLDDNWKLSIACPLDTITNYYVETLLIYKDNIVYIKDIGYGNVLPISNQKDLLKEIERVIKLRDSGKLNVN